MLLSVVLIALILIIENCSAFGCNQTAVPARYRCFPSIYGSSPVISPSDRECELFQAVLIQCLYTFVLGDGVMVPSPPDLNSEDYLGHFIAWERNSDQPYIDFDLTEIASAVTAIELSFLNSPEKGISLPDIQLSSVQYRSPISSSVMFNIGSVLLKNQDLTLSDDQVRIVTIQPLLPLQASNMRISFLFTDFHDFDWIFLSEVRFCVEEQPSFIPNIIEFLLSRSTTVQPSADDLRGGSTELVCTVSSQGSYTWQWERDNSVIGNGDPNYDITIRDGSRTTKLMISNLDFSDAGQYECTATFEGFNVTSTLVQTIKFPETVSVIPDLCGCEKSQAITYDCELYGYQLSSFTPPVWLNMNGSEITTSDKYTISSSAGVNTIVLENGTTLPSVIVSLTSHNLTSADEGDYTCRGTRGESVIRLTACTVKETPPTTSLPVCPSQATEHGQEQGVSSLGVSVIIALTVIILAMVVTILSLVIIIIFQLKRARKRSAILKHLHATNPLLNNDMVLNFAYQSETTSTDTVQYETIPESSARTTLSRNSAYQQSVVWLQEGNRNLREQVPPSEAMTEIDSTDGGTVTRQQEPSDYLLAVSTKTNTTDVENTMESVESEDRENSPDLVNLLLVSSEEDGQAQEVYLQGDRGSNQEEGEELGELEEQRSDAEQSVQGEQHSTAASTDQSEVEPVDKSVH